MMWIIFSVMILTFAIIKYPYIDENNNISERRFFKSHHFPSLISYGFFGLIIVNVVLYRNPTSIKGSILFLLFAVVSLKIMNYILKLLLTNTKLRKAPPVDINKGK